jgi:hypothetical protein
MTPAQEKRAKDIIQRQIAMSGQTLDALRQAGLTDTTAVQLDFTFDAPNEKAAKALVAQLGRNDCLDLAATKSGGFFSSKYTVSGKTYPTKVTTAVLAEWLPWIVVQGLVCDCEFDGWGAAV